VIRLAWRQFRVEAVIAAVLLGAACVAMAATGPHLASLYGTARDELDQADRGVKILGFAILLVGPALAGALFGAPLVARELETGTYRFAWTQSVSRTRWLVVKLALVCAVSVVLIGGVSAVAAWWATPILRAFPNRFDPGVFDVFGLVPAAYTLFAVALGATSGLLFRRALPAIPTTLALFVGVRLAVIEWLRPHFEAPLTAPAASAAASAPNVWLVSTARGVAKYQPAGRYWAFQGYEATLFVALALALGAFCVFWVRRRLV
jgi:hypothetical protein